MVAPAALILATVAAAGCRPMAPERPAEEHMPLPASIWLTSVPAEPAAPVQIVVTTPGDGTWAREHTFEPGVPLIGSIPLSDGPYRLSALGHACVIDLELGGEREADVLLRLLDGGACSLVQVREHGYGSGNHDGPSTLVAPGPSRSDGRP
jgi:hypothetical protein